MLSFGEAVDFALQNGRCVRRASWAAGQPDFLYLVKGSRFTVNRAPLTDLLPPGTEVEYRAHIDAIWTYAPGIVGAAVWTPTVADVLATDWVEVEPPVASEQRAAADAA